MNIFSNIHKNKTSFYLCLWWLELVLKICKILYYYEQQTSLEVFRTQSDIHNGVFFAKKRLLADNYFCKKALSYIFDCALNTTLNLICWNKIVYAHFILRKFSWLQKLFSTQAGVKLTNIFIAVCICKEFSSVCWALLF